MATVTEPEAIPKTAEALPRDYPPHRLTVERYERMVRAGIFGEKEPIFLWHGRLVEKMTIGPDHCNAAADLIAMLIRLIPDGWHVRAEQPVRISDDGMPEPDVTVIRGATRDYRGASPPRRMSAWSSRSPTRACGPIPVWFWRLTRHRAFPSTGSSTSPNGGSRSTASRRARPSHPVTARAVNTARASGCRSCSTAARSARSPSMISCRRRALSGAVMREGMPVWLGQPGTIGIEFAQEDRGSRDDGSVPDVDIFASHPPAGFSTDL